MKTLKKVSIGLFALILVLALASFLLPRQVRVERSGVVTAAPATVFEQINTLKNWEKWSPWHRIDPQMQLTYSGPAAGVGASYAWTSTDDNVGNGSFTITRSVPARRIDAQMNFMEEGTATCSYLLEPAATGTKVTWVMQSDLGYNPLSRYMGLLMEHFVGPDFDKGLRNLQEVAGGTPVARQ
jgi:Polyketide cyclase / dehydrase and lipid transport